MKRHFQKINQVERYLKAKQGVLIESTANDANLIDWDLRITGTTKNNRISTYTVKHNNSYHNDKICLEYKKSINNELHPSGITAVNSEYMIFTFYDDPKIYMIKREKLIAYAESNSPKPPVDYYKAMDKQNYQLVLFDRPSLLRRCKVI